MDNIFNEYWDTPLPTSFYKDEDFADRISKDQIPQNITPENYTKMCLRVNRYFPACDGIIQLIHKEDPYIGQFYDNMRFDTALKKVLYKMLANSLKRNFPESYYDGSIVIIYDNKELKAQSCQSMGILSYILANFPYKNNLNFTTEDVYLNLTLKSGLTADEQRGIIMELIKYLYQIVINDDRLRLLYSQMQQKFLEYHNEEEFDHPSILILSTLLSTILQQYGVQTYDSNLDWYNSDYVDLYIIFFPISRIGSEYTDPIHFKRDTLESTWRNEIINTLNHYKIEHIKSGYDKNGRYVIATYSDIQNIGELTNPASIQEIFLELIFLTNKFNTYY